MTRRQCKLRRLSVDEYWKSHPFCKSQIRLLKTESEPQWVSLSSFDVTPVPPVRISRGSTVIFDIVEYIIMDSNGMDNTE